MVHDIIITHAAVPTAWLSPSAMLSTALRNISLHAPTDVDLANTVPSAHPAARSPATNIGPRFTAHSDATIRLAAPSTHTLAARTAGAMLVYVAAGHFFAHHASAAERLGAS